MTEITNPTALLAVGQYRKVWTANFKAYLTPEFNARFEIMLAEMRAIDAQRKEARRIKNLQKYGLLPAA